MKTLYQNIKVKATKGKKTISRSDLFSYIDSDFENYGTDKVGEATAETELAVLEMDKDATLAQIFTDKEAMALSQEQILDFCENQKDKLKQDGYATFFLFKVGEDFFVANVYVRDDGHLGVRARRLDDDYVWDAEYRPRVVVPQQALKTLNSGTLETSALGHFCPHCKKELMVEVRSK